MHQLIIYDSPPSYLCSVNELMDSLINQPIDLKFQIRKVQFGMARYRKYGTNRSGAASLASVVASVMASAWHPLVKGLCGNLYNSLHSFVALYIFLVG